MLLLLLPNNITAIICLFSTVDGSVRPNIGFARSWTFGTKLDFRDREVGLFLWSYLDFLAIPKIQLRDIPTTKVQLRSSKLMFLPASFRTDFVVHYYVELVHRFPNIDA